MHTVADFAKKYGIPVDTVYSWLYRNKLDKFGIKKVVISGVQFLKVVSRKKLDGYKPRKKETV